MSVRKEWGMECPECHEDNRLMVEVKVMAHLSHDGTDPDGDQIWDDESPCECRHCGWTGTVQQAKGLDQSDGTESVR